MNAEELKFMRITAEYSEDCGAVMKVDPTAILCLINKISAAERERDELRAEQAEHDEQIARMESKFSLAKRALDSKTARCEKAEAELRRRDAAAGEPVAVISDDSLAQLKESYRPVLVFRPDHKRESQGVELYTAAQPVVLPPEIDDIWDATHLPCMATSNLDERECCVARDAYNQCRADALALGAQQQKVVEMPELQKWRKPDEVRAQSAYRNIIIQLLDAAGVKWEVKK